MIRNACKAVGSISDTSFDIRFNPDIFSPGTFTQSWEQPIRGQPDKNGSLAQGVAGCCLAGHGAGLSEIQEEGATMDSSAGAAERRQGAAPTV